MSRPAGLWEMVKLPMDLQRTKESSGGCQRSSNSQVDVFKLFPLAVAGERHDGAARIGTFGGAMPVVDGVLSVGQMGGVWRHQRRHAGQTMRAGRSCATNLFFGRRGRGGAPPTPSSYFLPTRVY